MRVIAILIALCAIAHADTEARWMNFDTQPHAGVPFTVQLGIAGFDESPAVELPPLTIAGAKVTPLGATPNTSRSIQIINGRRSQSSETTWYLRWRVEMDKPGKVDLPTVTLSQGSKKATAKGASFQIDTVPTTDAMKLEMTLPARSVFVGETFAADLVFTFRAQPRHETFTIPIANLDQFTVSAPPVTDKDQVIQIPVGGKTLQVPYDSAPVEINGQRWQKASLHLIVAPRTSGKVEVPPASVVASLGVGQADFFGNQDTREFRAMDTAKTLDVKPLPETDRPASFAGAVGSSFSIKVETSRSVVSIGEPVDLTVTVKSDQRLDTLALGKLTGEGALPADKFQVPPDPPTGELSADGKSKTFKITATVTGAATEIPAITFAYFDPAKIQYQTTKSDPIALSVKGGTVVGADSVVAIQKKPGAQAQQNDDVALVGAELALSAPGETAAKPIGGVPLVGLLVLFYVGSLAVFALFVWKHRTAEQREDASEVKQARRKVDDALAAAERDPARDAAGPLAASLRALARACEREVDDHGLLEKLETESYSRDAKDRSVSKELVSQARGLADRWVRDARKAPAKGKATTVMLALFVLAAPSIARAQADGSNAAKPATPTTAPSLGTASSSGDVLATGREAYQQALGTTDASTRKAAFTRAAASLGEAAQATPGQPELLTDWGNAALGAGDVGSATLAYRRALAIDPTNTRAKKNLNWLRSHAPDNLRPVASNGATDTLFFFNSWSRARRLLVGGLAFAIAILVIVPWTGKRRRGMGLLAILPGAVWLAMTLSVVLEDRHADDAVVMDSVTLRAADSSGAPAALSTPLPRGTELTVVEKRADWAKVKIAAGTQGWIPSGAIQTVH
ncbi:MAG: hypothetical protein QM831_30465 [Kofleriaceae bacterium]